MKNHIENTRYLAELEVCSRIWRVLDRLPHSSEKELNSSFLNRLHWNGAYIAQKWDFGDNSFNLLFRDQVFQYVVDDDALDAFCASLSSSLGLSD